MDIKIHVVVGEFHRELTEIMVQKAKEKAQKLNVKVIDTTWIPGSFEAPFAIKEIFESKQCDAVVLLGYIEKGETLHGEVIGNTVTSKLLDLQLEYRKPIGFGIVGPGATLEQAKLRIEKSAENAVVAAVEMFKFKNKLI